MPNMKNAKKAVKTSAKRKVENNDFKASMKTAIKRIDKAASAGVITANYVARTKSRLTLKVNNME